MKKSASILILLSTFYSAYCQTPELLRYSKRDGSEALITTKKQWEKKRSQVLLSMEEVMGPLQGRSGKTNPPMEVLSEMSHDGIRQMRITFSGEDNDMIPAILMIPEKTEKAVPGILCLHQTIECGKAEPAGLCGNPDLHYALELARRGYITLSPDYPNFGEYKFDPYSHGYSSATMKGIRNHLAAVSLLQSLPEADPGRIGCIGHSLGGHNTLFLAAFDKRVKAAVTSCGFTAFHRYYGGDLTGWSHKGYMPAIAEKYGKDPDRMPFDFLEVLAAIAPRPVFINAPLHDSNFDIEGVRECVEAVEPVYSLLGAPGCLIMKNPDAQHSFPKAEREEAYLFLDRILKDR